MRLVFVFLSLTLEFAFAELCAQASGIDDPVKTRMLQDEARRRGYLEELSFPLAVQEFNMRQTTDTVGRSQPLLTVDELAAAIRGCDPVASRLTRREYHLLQDIAGRSMLPKGAYIDFSNLSNELEKKDAALIWNIRIWHVWLVLGRDRNPPGFGQWTEGLRMVRIPIRTCFLKSEKIH